MLLLLQIAFAVMFIITLFQVIIDFFYGTYLIVTGLILLVVAYVIKVFAWILHIIHPGSGTIRHSAAKPARKAATWRVIP